MKNKNQIRKKILVVSKVASILEVLQSVENNVLPKSAIRNFNKKSAAMSRRTQKVKKNSTSQNAKEKKPDSNK